MAGVLSPFGGGATASQLADLTGTVNVGSAAAPVTGYALLASSATTGTWGAVGGAVSAVGTLIDATGSVSVGAATAPGAAGSVLVSSAAGTAIWSATTGSVAYATSAGTVQYAGTATLATAAGTATITNALADSTGTVNISAAAAPATNQVLTAQSATTAAWGTGYSLLASTGSAGYPLANNTGTILSYVMPNDGNLHRAEIFGVLIVTSGETGGQVSVTVNLPNGGISEKSLFSSGQAAGTFWPISFSYPQQQLVAPNATIIISQTSSLTIGTSTVWAEIWGS